MSTVQFLMLLPGSVAAVVTLAVQAGKAMLAWGPARSRWRSYRLKRRLLGKRRNRKRKRLEAARMSEKVRDAMEVPDGQ